MKHLTPAEYRAEVAKSRKRRKYGNEPIVVDATRFDSKKEARHYIYLKHRERMGEIKDLELQPKYPIELGGVKVCAYVADFRYRCRRTGEYVVEDVKSEITRKNQAYRIKKKLVRAVYGIDIVEI